MPGLAAVIATLLRFRARACVVLACMAAMLCAATIASANPSTQTKTRVWDFSFAEPLNIRLNAVASPRTHLENPPARSELASGSLLAARGGAQAPKLLGAVPKSVTNTANHIFGPKSLATHKLGPVLDAFGGDAVAATYRLQNAAQALANQGAIKGVFQTTVEVAGHNVTVRGAVIDGVANLRTAFIP